MRAVHPVRELAGVAEDLDGLGRTEEADEPATLVRSQSQLTGAGEDALVVERVKAFLEDPDGYVRDGLRVRLAPVATARAAGSRNDDDVGAITGGRSATRTTSKDARSSSSEISQGTRLDFLADWSTVGHAPRRPGRLAFTAGKSAFAGAFVESTDGLEPSTRLLLPAR